MRYSVKWSKRAKNEQLVEIWLQATDCPAVTRAVHEVEVLLSYQAETVGESRNKNRRVLFHPPLVVHFRIDHTANTVKIFNVLPLS